MIDLINNIYYSKVIGTFLQATVGFIVWILSIILSFVFADGQELKEGGPSVDIRRDSQSNLEAFVEQPTPNEVAARNHGPSSLNRGGSRI